MKTSMKAALSGALLLFCGNLAAGEVSRALFTLGIDDREPALPVDSLDHDSHNRISFFTEVNDMTGRIVTHQWMHQDKVMFEKTFEIKSERWRIWTSKTLIPSWTGTWTVNVLGEERELLASKSFEYL